MSERQISIIIDTSTINISSSGSITGVVYFDFGDYQFPNTTWSDFTVVILSWWLESIYGVLTGEETFVELDFMDGAPLVICKKIDQNHFLIECYESSSGSSSYTTKIAIDDFLVSIINISKTLFEHCITENWSNRDIDNLKFHLSVLEDYSRKNLRKRSKLLKLVK